MSVFLIKFQPIVLLDGRILRNARRVDSETETEGSDTDTDQDDEHHYGPPFSQLVCHNKGDSQENVRAQKV